MPFSGGVNYLLRVRSAAIFHDATHGEASLLRFSPSVEAPCYPFSTISLFTIDYYFHYLMAPKYDYYCHVISYGYNRLPLI